MRFLELPLSGAFLIEPERLEDERGFFARTFCRQEFSEHGLHVDFVQCNVSHNRRAGTLRGMHFQAAPHEEAKVVSCVRGAIFDVVVDLRPSSPTRGKWHGVELNESNRHLLYVPQGFAHGFQSLVDESDVFYQMSTFFDSASARGIAWDDPDLGIPWPLPVTVVSGRDRSYPLLGRLA